MNTKQYPIPDGLNAVLVLGTVGGMLTSLIYLGTTQDDGVIFYGVNVLFSLLFITNYSLLHEACHNKLNSRPWLNYVLGNCSAYLFPISFSIIRKTHTGHHLRNRSDDEMFDLYYENDNVLITRIRWYSLLIGVHYLAMVVTSLVLPLIPRQHLVRVMSKSPTYGPFVDSALTPTNIFHARLEAVIVIVLLVLAFSHLNMLNVLPGFYLAVFLWSTNQYLPHAYAKRDLVEGGYNLTGTGLLSWFMLKRENDLTHHREPNLPWLYLSSKRKHQDERVNYYRQWLRQWKGPRLTQHRSQAKGL